MAREIVMPRLSDSMEEGTILKWHVAAGDTVSPGDPLVDVETDKAIVTHEADEAATVLGLLAAEGESIAVGAPILVVGAPGESMVAPVGVEHASGVVATAGAAAPPVSAAGPPVSAAAPPPNAPRPASVGRVKASPLARRIAASLGVDLAALAGSGPGGRIIRSDVEAAAAVAGGNGAGSGAGNGDGHAAPPDGQPATGEVTVHAMSSVQRTIARRMSESRATVPDIELRVEVDMTAAVGLRAQLREVAGERLPSLNDLIVKAAALALRDHPRVGGSYRDGSFETYGRVNIGIAVAAEDALVVPTVFDADRKSLGEIAQTTRALAARVRDGSVTPTELSGATFTISNLGMFGVDSFSAVINPPQAAILAVGALRRRPVVLDSGEIAARDTVQLALACDHRIVYGADGARFLARLRELLEAPLALAL